MAGSHQGRSSVTTPCTEDKEEPCVEVKGEIYKLYRDKGTLCGSKGEIYKLYRDKGTLCPPFQPGCEGGSWPHSMNMKGSLGPLVRRTCRRGRRTSATTSGWRAAHSWPSMSILRTTVGEGMVESSSARVTECRGGREAWTRVTLH